MSLEKQIKNLTKALTVLTVTLNNKKSTHIPEKHILTPEEENINTVRIEGIKAALLSLAKAKGRGAVLNFLKKFGAEHVTELKEDKYAEIIIAAEEAGLEGDGK